MKKIIVEIIAWILFASMVMGVTIYGLIMWSYEVQMF